MPPPRFLQLHTLTSYPSTLLNRDDVGFAKRIPFGGVERGRISSQCLKRHWREADSDQQFRRMQGVERSIPSRRGFEREVLAALVDLDPHKAVGVVIALKLFMTMPSTTKLQRKKIGTAWREQFDAFVNGDDEAKEQSLRTDQVITLGAPELRYLSTLAREILSRVSSPNEAFDTVAARCDANLAKNLAALRVGAGIEAALFGRMVTGDVLARCDAAVHVAHAFTVHAGTFETDYFSAVDDLQSREETGSGHINTSELTTGLYYGYVVVDLPLLVSNLEGCPLEQWKTADRSLAGEVVRRLFYLVATITPGAKKGATAPYATALALLAETGDAQPRTLANAFLDAVNGKAGLLPIAQSRLASHLRGLDEMYGRSTKRRVAAVDPTDDLLAAADGRLPLTELAQWAARELSAT